MNNVTPIIAQKLILPGGQGEVTGPLNDPKFTNSEGIITLGQIITEALKYIYPIAGFILFVFIIASGFQMLTASGDPKKIESARGRLTYAILGFILLVASPWIARIVELLFSPEQPFF